MKINKILGLFAGASLLMLSSCESIEDRDELSNSFNPDAIDLEVVQATPGGNKLSIQMNTPGIVGYWDYLIDKKYTDRVEVIFPFTGSHTFTFHVTTPYMPSNSPDTKEYIEKSITVDVNQLDEELPDAFYALVGDNLEGKTWVFDGGPEPDGGKWWYMSSPDNWEELWWNAAGDCCPPADADGKMVFDLAGGTNYTYFDSADADGEKGSFTFNGDYTSITFNDVPILGYDAERVNPDSKYTIISLTSEQLILHTSTNAGGTGWVWIFVPAE